MFYFLRSIPQQGFSFSSAKRMLYAPLSLISLELTRWSVTKLHRWVLSAKLIKEVYRE